MVTHYKSSGTVIDQKAIEQQLQDLQLPGATTPDGGGLPGLPQIDLGQPPKIE